MGRLLTCIDRFPIGHRSSEIWHLDFGEKFAFFTHCFPSVFLQWPSMDFGWFSMFFRGKSPPDIPQSVSRPKIWFLIDLWWFQSDWSTPGVGGSMTEWEQCSSSITKIYNDMMVGFYLTILSLGSSWMNLCTRMRSGELPHRVTSEAGATPGPGPRSR